MEDADIWFIRFSMDRWCTRLACGSRTGRVFAWDLMAPSDQAARAKAVMRIPSTTPCTVSHPARPIYPGPLLCRADHVQIITCLVQVRQTAVSDDGKIILACCEDSTICRFDAN